MNSFLQSQEWEKFQQSFGRKTWRVKGLLIIKHNLPFGFNYLYCPRPTFAIDPTEDFLEEIKKIASSEKSIFLKIEPEADNFGFLKKISFLKSTKELQPSRTLILDLTKREAEIIGQMHEKTRYNIHVAQKHGIEIKELADINFEDVWKILESASKRDQFSLHPRGYYKKMIELLAPSGMLKVFGAFSDQKLIAANLMVFYNGRATYLHGGSDYKYRNLMAPYLLHWIIIKKAKVSGFKEYDFWGISERYPGVTRFKNGFGGKEITYPGSFDYIFSQFWYIIYNGVKS